MDTATHAPVRSQMGTVPYTAPETFTHDRITKQTDVYAFGIIREPRFPLVMLISTLYILIYTP